MSLVTYKNPLIEARDRNRPQMLKIASPSRSGVGAPVQLVQGMTRPLLSPLVRRMGETTLDTRGREVSKRLWANTPVDEMSVSVGDPTFAEEDITDFLTDFDSVGWQWSRETNKLKAYLTSKGRTFVVKIPLAKLLRIFNRCHKANFGTPGPYREKTLNGFFKKLGRGLKKMAKGVVKNTIKSITAPVRFFKNPKKFIKDTAQHIKKTVKGVGKTVLKVASSPIFAGVMTAISAIPPLTAVGAVGLAAFAAANAIKPAFNVAEKAIDTVDAIAKRKRIKANINALPPGAKNLMGAALKSTAAKSNLSRSVFKLAGGALKRVF